MYYSSKQIKEYLESIVNREINDYDLRKLLNTSLLKRVKFKHNYYYKIITNQRFSIVEVLDAD